MAEKRPYVVVEWNDTESEAQGWLCAFNFVKNYTGGGTRMHPTVTREEVIRLATTMGYKYKVIESETTGGCKGGIAYDYKAPDAKAVLRRYLTAMLPYIKAGVSIGGDLGVDYGDVLEFLDEVGVGLPQTKAMAADPAIQQGIQNHDDACHLSYDGFKMYDMITGYGVAFAADEAWQFKQEEGSARPGPGARVIIQGFGAVGASCAYCMDKMGYKVVGISDVNGLVYNDQGLDVKGLVKAKKPKGEMDPASFREGDQWLEGEQWALMPCDILIPAALEDVIHKDNADLIQASLIVEAANIPTTPQADEILLKKGKDVVVDFVANIGGVRIYEALVFRIVKDPVPADIVADTEDVARRQTRRLLAEARKSGRGTREVAREIFAPDTFDTPDI